jgi:hypothetical protein
MERIYKIGVFGSEESFLDAIRKLQEKKIPVFDVYTPYPIHEVFHLLKRSSKIPLASYFFGLFGVAATLSFLYYTSVISWPLRYGGKPFNSFPSFVIVTIVLTIFTVTILSLGLFSARARMFPGRQNTIFRPEATDDKFVIVTGPTGSEDTTGAEAVEIMDGSGAIAVTEKNLEKVLV